MRGRGNQYTYRRLDMLPNGTSTQNAMDVDRTLAVFDPTSGGAKRDDTEAPRARSEAPSPDAKKTKGNPSETESATAAEQLRPSQ
jgi:hypothetical protein